MIKKKYISIPIITQYISHHAASLQPIKYTAIKNTHTEREKILIKAQRKIALAIAFMYKLTRCHLSNLYIKSNSVE